MKIKKEMFGNRSYRYEIVRTLPNGIVRTVFLNVYGVNRVRVALALLFAVIDNYNMVEYILEH